MVQTHGFLILSLTQEQSVDLPTASATGRRWLKDYNTCLSCESLLRVWKDILGIRDLIEIHWGIREKAKFLDVMRDLTVTVEAGLAVLEKKTEEVRDARLS